MVVMGGQGRTEEGQAVESDGEDETNKKDAKCRIQLVGGRGDGELCGGRVAAHG